MPMLEAGSAWPPEGYGEAMSAVQRDAAILSGDPASLRRVYNNRPRPYRHRAQYNGGIVGSAARGLLGSPEGMDGEQGRVHIDKHLPVAADLVEAAAALMTDQPPKLTLHEDDAENKEAAEALEVLTGTDQFAADWSDTVYKAGGLGWMYGRVVWNQEIQQHPWVEWVDADRGMCEFQNGRPVSFTFWDTYEDPHGQAGSSYWRLVQHHTPGWIEYQLFHGSDKNLGRAVPFDDCPHTAYLADTPGLENGTMLATGAEGLTAAILPNYKSRMEWRDSPTLQHYSASDVSRGGDIWFDIDKTWTDLTHEAEAARARIFVSEELMVSGPPGQGKYFEWARDVFKLASSGMADEAGHIELVQPDIRVEKYLNLLEAATRKAIDAVGLSPITVGMDAQATGDMTATETRARSDRSIKTVNVKGRMQRAHLSTLCTAYLQVDAALNGYQPPEKPVNVALPNPVQETNRDISEEVTQRYTAGVQSLKASVTRLHPEWTEAEIEAEVEQIIKEERSRAGVDPFSIGQDEYPGDDSE